MAPTVIVCVGMAGSGKTTFMQRLNVYLHAMRKPPYVLNLDPAVLNLPFEANIDIRDSINYKEVMKQYGLGPNGAITTCLNLFATKVDQILGIIEKRAPEHEYIIVDTPGQMEVFLWSASGQILLDTLASSYPTVLAYVIDTPRSSSPATFMSNMLYACSILYKANLPMVLVCNKTDVKEADFVKEWMTNFEAFQQAVRNEKSNEGEEGMGYMGSLMGSMGLVLEEFYHHLDVVGVSSVLGSGMKEFFAIMETKKEEYEKEYKPELERRIKEREEERKTEGLDNLMRDMKVGSDPRVQHKPVHLETISDGEDEDDGYIVDPDPMNDEDESLQAKFEEAARNAQRNAEEADFNRWTSQINKGGS